MFKYIFLCVTLLLFSTQSLSDLKDKNTMQLTSTAFINAQMMPEKYTCDGDDISPPLAWSDVPHNAKSLVLIMDDPDAPHGTWDHWILYNIPATMKDFSEKISLPKEINVGKNSWGKNAYGGACPPPNLHPTTHRYFFKLYALDVTLPLENGAPKAEVEKAMKSHVIAEAELMGKYKRK